MSRTNSSHSCLDLSITSSNTFSSTFQRRRRSQIQTLKSNHQPSPVIESSHRQNSISKLNSLTVSTGSENFNKNNYKLTNTSNQLMSTIKYSNTSVPASIHLRLLLEHQILQKQHQQQLIHLNSLKNVIEKLQCQLESMKDQSELLEFKFLEQQQMLSLCARCSKEIDQEEHFDEGEDEIEISRL